MTKRNLIAALLLVVFALPSACALRPGMEDPPVPQGTALPASSPEPTPTPEPSPTPEPTPGSTDPAQPKPLVRTGDRQGPLHLIAVAVVTAGAALAASLGFRGKEDDR